jgi:hypothetical protein
MMPSLDGVDVPDMEIEELDAEAWRGMGTTYPWVAKPLEIAYSTRPASTSIMVTIVHPDCRAMAATRSPTVPAPITRAVEPGTGEARLREWIATERGSRRAAASKETLSGILCSKHQLLSLQLRGNGKAKGGKRRTCDTKSQDG